MSKTLHFNSRVEGHQDVSWRDAFDVNDAVEFLNKLSDEAGRRTDFNSASMFHGCAMWLAEQEEKIAKLNDALLAYRLAASLDKERQ